MARRSRAVIFAVVTLLVLAGAQAGKARAVVYEVASVTGNSRDTLDFADDCSSYLAAGQVNFSALMPLRAPRIRFVKGRPRRRSIKLPAAGQQESTGDTTVCDFPEEGQNWHGTCSETYDFGTLGANISLKFTSVGSGRRGVIDVEIAHPVATSEAPFPIPYMRGTPCPAPIMSSHHNTSIRLSRLGRRRLTLSFPLTRLTPTPGGPHRFTRDATVKLTRVG